MPTRLERIFIRPEAELTLVTLLAVITLLLIWARFRVFQTKNPASIKASLIYDPVVAIHLLMAFYCFYASDYSKVFPILVPLILYLCAISLFIWSIKTTTRLKFALSTTPEKIITHGAFRFTRHPFYTSYILTWTASCLAYSSTILWTTLIYLIGFYVYSAKQEEGAILKGPEKQSYKLYQQQVGMFLPRISSWLKSHSAD